MKQVLDILDYTGGITFTYSIIMGLAAQIGMAEINPAITISAIGGFVWIIVKSIMMFKAHNLKVDRERVELDKLKLETERERQKIATEVDKERLEILKTKQEWELEFKKKTAERIFRNSTVYISDPKDYAEALRLEEEYNDALESIVKRQKLVKG